MYDSAPNYGDGYKLENMPLPSVSDLLCGYLASLPTPLIEHAIFQQLLQECVLPSWEDARFIEDGGNIPSDTAERSRIAIAQSLLRQLPKPNLDLIIFLFSFLVNVPQHPKNGKDNRYIAALFGPSICSSRDTTGASTDDMNQAVRMAREMVLWLLLFWNDISKGLSPETPTQRARPNLAAAFAKLRTNSLTLREEPPSPPFSPLDTIAHEAPQCSASQWPVVQRLGDRKATPKVEKPDVFFASEMHAEHHGEHGSGTSEFNFPSVSYISP